MNQINEWIQFLTILKGNSIKCVILDGRGTLIKPFRDKNLSRIAENWGIDCNFVEIDSFVSKQVKLKYLENEDVLDWTLVTILELFFLYKENLDSTGPIELEASFQKILKEYKSLSTNIVKDESFYRFIKYLRAENIKVCIAVDGMKSREIALFKRLFPISFSYIFRFYSSDVIGKNKLSTFYYKFIANDLGLKEDEILVIGDRIDKDVKVANKSGCSAILCHNNSPLYSGPIIKDLNLLLSTVPPEMVKHGVVLGRFQPFHLEHLRYILAAYKRCSRLYIGITNPFCLDDVGHGKVDNSSKENDPLPYWLRIEMIKHTLEKENININSTTFLPVELKKLKHKSMLPTNSVIYVTLSDQWSYEKKQLLEKFGYVVEVLDVGERTISGSLIRKYIRDNNENWKNMLPVALQCEFSDLLLKYIQY